MIQVGQRLKTYENLTAPLLDFYDNRGMLEQADGSDFPELLAADKRSDAVYATLKPALEKMLQL